MAQLSNEERELLRSNLRAFMAAKSDEMIVRRLAETETGVDLAVWHELAAELGVAGLLAPEAHGGLGLGYPEAALLLEEAARELYSGPVLSSAVLAPAALMAAGEAACERHFPDLVAGAVFAVAVEDAPEAVVVAQGGGEDWRLSGRKTAVIDAGVAQWLLVVAQGADGTPGLFAVDPAAGGVTLTALDVLDRSRRQAEAAFDGAPARRLSGDFTAGLAKLLDVGATAAAAEQLGVAQRALEIAADYAKLRQQFGQPIGSFQAVKHLCADMLSRVECLRAAVRAAASALEGDPRERAETVSVAKAFGSEAATFVTTTTIQVLGGIGFTWAHPAHLYLRRAKTLQFAFGDAAYHRTRIARLAGLIDAA